MRCSRCLWAVVLTCTLAASSSGANPRASTDSGAKPVLVLREGLNGAINEWSAPAKFVLYDDGTVFAEASNEKSGGKHELRYLKTHLTPVQANRLIAWLCIKKIVVAAERQYGQGEGVTWQLIYWGSLRRAMVTVVGSLSEAPRKVAKLVGRLESYPKRGTRYLAYDYVLRFSADEGPSVPWPKTWRSVKFSREMLAGYSEPDTVYMYRLDAPHSLQLIAMLTKARTERISVNGYAWHVDVDAAPRLPNDVMWVQHPL